MSLPDTSTTAGLVAIAGGVTAGDGVKAIEGDGRNGGVGETRSLLASTVGDVTTFGDGVHAASKTSIKIKMMGSHTEVFIKANRPFRHSGVSQFMGCDTATV
jgi:hypothetical protein